MRDPGPSGQAFLSHLGGEVVSASRQEDAQRQTEGGGGKDKVIACKKKKKPERECECAKVKESFIVICYNQLF